MPVGAVRRFARQWRRVTPGMTDHPHQAGSTEADPEKQSTPAGVVRDLEEEADETGATVEPDEPTPAKS
jgi:hypothetical protein